MATIIGTSGANWGLTAESGLLVQSVTAKITREKVVVRSNVGDATLVSYYNPSQVFNANGVVLYNGGSWQSITPGIALSLANSNAFNGVTAGGIYCDDVELTKTATDFQKIAGTFTQYPLIA